MALELSRTKPSVPRGQPASPPNKPALPEAVTPIAWSGQGSKEPDATWATLPPAIRNLAAKQGMAPPSGDVPSSHVARHGTETLAWWVDVSTGAITLARSLPGAAPAFHRYRPGDPGVIARRATLPAVPAAASPNGPPQGEQKRPSSWREDPLWLILPADAKRQLDEVFGGDDRLVDGEATIESNVRGAREVLRLTQWGWATIAGVAAIRTVTARYDDLVLAGQVLQAQPWDVIFFAVPVAAQMSVPVAAPAGRNALGPGRQ